jgi:hypothetical protein
MICNSRPQRLRDHPGKAAEFANVGAIVEGLFRGGYPGSRKKPRDGSTPMKFGDATARLTEAGKITAALEAALAATAARRATLPHLLRRPHRYDLHRHRQSQIES